MHPAGDERRNVELKATDPAPERSIAVCRSLGAQDRGLVVQRDTYFEARHGRLKLREQTPGSAQLIHYERASRPRERESRYRIAEIPDAASLRAALAAALGIRVVVAKRRRLFLHEHVRIHLDEVEGLGAFLEFEAVAPPGSDLAREYERVAELRAAFGVTDDRLRAAGYAEQLLARRA